MVKTLLERMRPTTIKDYIGNSQQIDSLRIYMQGRIKKDAVLLQGPPGTGKTTLAYLIAEEFDYDVIEINASDERKKKDLDRILTVTPISGFGARLKLPIIDECDGCSLSFLKKILDMDGKKILISNEMLDWDLMRRIHQVAFTPPKKWMLKKVISEAGHSPEGAPLGDFNSFRDALNWCEGGMLPPKREVSPDWNKMIRNHLYSGGDPFFAEQIVEKIRNNDFPVAEFRKHFRADKTVKRNVVKQRGHIAISGIVMKK